MKINGKKENLSRVTCIEPQKGALTGLDVSCYKQTMNRVSQLISSKQLLSSYLRLLCPLYFSFKMRRDREPLPLYVNTLVPQNSLIYIIHRVQCVRVCECVRMRVCVITHGWHTSNTINKSYNTIKILTQRSKRPYLLYEK